LFSPTKTIVPFIFLPHSKHYITPYSLVYHVSSYTLVSVILLILQCNHF
jgi:hypothetical protein